MGLWAPAILSVLITSYESPRVRSLPLTLTWLLSRGREDQHRPQGLGPRPGVEVLAFLGAG